MARTLHRLHTLSSVCQTPPKKQIGPFPSWEFPSGFRAWPCGQDHCHFHEMVKTKAEASKRMECRHANPESLGLSPLMPRIAFCSFYSQPAGTFHLLDANTWTCRLFQQKTSAADSLLTNRYWNMFFIPIFYCNFLNWNLLPYKHLSWHSTAWTRPGCV